MTNYGLLILGAGTLIVLLLFSGTIITVATGVFADLSSAIAGAVSDFGNILNPTPSPSQSASPSPSPTPTPSSGPTPTPTTPPSNIVLHITFKIAGTGSIVWTDTTSGTSGTVNKQIYPLGSATFAFNSNDKLSIKAVDSPYGNVFDHYFVSGTSGGVSTQNPLVITLLNDFTITAYFVYSG